MIPNGVGACSGLSGGRRRVGFTGVTANGKSMDTLNPVQITMPDTSVADMASDGSFSVNYTGTGFAQWFGL